MQRVEIWANRAAWRRGFEILPVKTVDGKQFVQKSIEWREQEPHEIHDPALSHVLDETAAQKLMDQLWDCGLRPTQGAGSAGALAATQKHLEDMRMLVFEVRACAPKADRRQEYR
jgi:hypothetical protein